MSTVVDVSCHASTVPMICFAGEKEDNALPEENQNSMETTILQDTEIHDEETSSSQETTLLQKYWYGFTALIVVTVLFFTVIFFYGLRFWLKEW